MKERFIQVGFLSVYVLATVVTLRSMIPKPGKTDPAIVTVPIGLMNITAYQPKKKQTDSSPWSTSIGERVTIRGCAVSQDMLADNGGPLHYGDLLFIEHVGFRFVNDCMNKRISHGLDLWVPTQEAERKVFSKFHNGLRNVYLVIRRGDIQ
jgi:hypothetical protein